MFRSIMSTASVFMFVFIIIISLCNFLLVVISMIHQSNLVQSDTETTTKQTKKLKILRKVHYNDEIKFGQPLKEFEPPHPKLQAKNQIQVTDVFFAVRTTSKYHKTRMKLALETWLSDVEENYYIFTDSNDELFDSSRVVETDCPTSKENKYALLCKLYWEFRTYLSMIYKKSWFCHFDDDTFVNVNNLFALLSLYSSTEHVYLGRSPTKHAIIANAYDTNFEVADMEGLEDMNAMSMYGDTILPYRVGFHYAIGGAGYCISRQLAIDMKYHIFGANMIHSASSLYLPDDRVLGYVVTNLLETSLINVNTMNSHTLPLWKFPDRDLFKQITLSYALPSADSNDSVNMEDFIFYNDKKLLNISAEVNKTFNTIYLPKGHFTFLDDPTRLRSFHKLLKDEK